MHESFRWGVATSSHQIEGGNRFNDWWTWELQGKIERGETSGRATDHWHRFREDLRHAADMGVNSYRFSIEWSRLEPAEGEWNQDAIDWYKELLSECENWGLEPMLTLHHFTLPQWVAERGGFSWDKMPDYYLKFVRKVVESLGARVPLWCTLNEPVAMLAGQYIGGFMPPAEYSPEKASAAFSNLVRCHIRGYQAVHGGIEKRTGPWRNRPLMVGCAHNMIDFIPARHWHPIDRLATKIFHGLYNRAWLDALTGRKQSFGVQGFLPTSPVVTEALGRKWLDFIGVNYYLKSYLRWRPHGKHYEKLLQFPLGVAFSDGEEPVSEMGWAVHPGGLRRILKIVSEYGVPIFITENGIADRTDKMRGPYLTAHLKEVASALERGIDIRGYYHWSLIDNFEWIKGFAPRFGLIEIDYETMARGPRASAKLYREIIEAHHHEHGSPQMEILRKFIK